MRYINRTPSLLLLLALLMFAEGCTVSHNPMSGQRRLFAYTWEQEQQIGREADQQIQTHFGVYDDAGLSDYVNRVAEAVLEESHMRRPDARLADA
jgi:predicted Zn-dependent protease